MIRSSRVQHFDSEGRENLPQVIKALKNYLRAFVTSGINMPAKMVFFTALGEGPMLAYNDLAGLGIKIIAVTFPPSYTVKRGDNIYKPEIPDMVRKFFKGVEIPIVTSRLPFDHISGAISHNQEMSLIRDTLSLFGGSIPLAIQCVLQAADCGLVDSGEQVIAVTGDTALLVTASTTQNFLSKECGLMVNEVICKPRSFTRTRPHQSLLAKPEPEIQRPDE